MTTDAMVSRELRSLQDELSISQRERVPPAPSVAGGTTAMPPFRRQRLRKNKSCVSSCARL